MRFRLVLCAVLFSVLPAFGNELPERDYVPKYADQAWGVLSERPVRSAGTVWPVKVLSIGHTIASYQDYGGDPYFHHGLDIRAEAGSNVVAAAGGKVINIENYEPGDPAYWEIAILDDDGFIWQYHHIDHNSIPQSVWDAFRSGGRVASGDKLGEVFYWSIVTFGERYHHTHVNVLGAGKKYLNPFAFLPSLPDNDAPKIVDIGLLKNGRKVSGDSVSGSYSIYAEIDDLILSRVFVVPPNQVSVAIDGRDPVVVWTFDELPGGASKTELVDTFYVKSMVCGDYQCRRPVIDLGFSTTGGNRFPTTAGPHSVVVSASDYTGNRAEREFTYQVR